MLAHQPGRRAHPHSAGHQHRRGIPHPVRLEVPEQRLQVVGHFAQRQLQIHSQLRHQILRGQPLACHLVETLRQLREPREILGRLNDELAAQNPRGMFVTMACLEVRGDTVTCANAGHDTALLVKPSGEQRAVFPSSGRVLGLFPGQEYANETLELLPGDSLLFYTDGVTEAADAAGALFGEERLHACFAGGAGTTAARTVDLLLGAVRAFAGGAPQSDDITILALRRT